MDTERKQRRTVGSCRQAVLARWGPGGCRSRSRRGRRGGVVELAHAFAMSCLSLSRSWCLHAGRGRWPRPRRASGTSPVSPCRCGTRSAMASCDAERRAEWCGQNLAWSLEVHRWKTRGSSMYH